jgi:hypothetical protein
MGFFSLHPGVLALVVSLGLATAPPNAARAESPQPATLIASVKSIDIQHHQVVFPIHRGVANGQTVWYVLTDVSDANAAKNQGLIFAPAIANVGTEQGVTVENGTWHFAGAPAFSSARVFKPGPSGFPPADAMPGAKADDKYSPFVRVSGSSTVYNAPIVAVGDGPFDVVRHTNTAPRVLALDPAAASVTLLLADGFAGGRQVFYISTEVSDPGTATMERATYAPELAKSGASARLPIYVVANGKAQGLSFVALNGKLTEDPTASNSAELLSPHNVLSSAPTVITGGNASYSPLWDVYVGAWTPAAAQANRNVQLTSTAAVTQAVSAHDLTGPGSKPFGPVGVVVNCPVVAISQ